MALEDADKQAIQEMISKALEGLPDKLAERFVTPDAATKIVSQAVEKALEQQKPAPPEPEQERPAGGKGKGEDDQVAARLKELEQRLAEERQAREQAEERARQQRLEAAAREALVQAGVPAERAHHALAYLRTLRTDDGKPVLDVDEQGRPVWRDQRKGYVETLGLSDGLKAWAETDDGKAFRPAVGTRGTGDSAGGVGAGRPQLPRDEQGRLDWSALSSRLNLGQVQVVD